MGVYVSKQHSPAQLAQLQREVVDTFLLYVATHKGGFNQRALETRPPQVWNTQ